MARGRAKKKSSKLVVSRLLDDAPVVQKRKKTQSQNFVDDFDKPGPSGYQNLDKNKKNNFPQETAALSELASSSTESLSESESEAAAGGNNDGSSRGSSGRDVDDPRETSPGFVKLEADDPSPPSRESGLEKSNKRIFLQDGKVLRVKSERKDKGKARFTAYMLWAKEIRPKLLDEYPDMDFGTISKRLGELWAAVPNLEKCNWRRRAKRMIFDTRSRDSPRRETSWKIPAPTSGCKFINRIQNFKEKKSSNAHKTKQQAAREKKNANLPSPSNSGCGDVSLAANPRQRGLIGTRPIDVAAHLSLLGESLIVIGELLTNYEGKIALCGSLSVLLDSLLCALGPLVCLTQQVPEANGADPETLARMLDNLAYIMPGL